jgi:hypothetical protein
VGVDRQAAVGVAVEGDPALGSGVLHRPRERVEMRGADLGVDVPAVGLGADERRVEAELPGEERRDGCGGAVRAVEEHPPVAAQPVAVRRRKPVDIAPHCVLDRLDAPAARPGARAHRRLDVGLGGVGELAPVRSEKLDAVVLVRVVRRRDDAAQLGPEPPDQHRHARRRDDPGRERDASARDDPLDEGLLERRARFARVTPEDDRAARPGDRRRRGAQVARPVLGQIDAGDSPHAVCPEQLAERCQGPAVSASRTAAACAPS